MATFSGNAAGYRLDFVNGKIRVVDIDASDGDTGRRIVSGDQKLRFDDASYQLTTSIETRVNTSSPYYLDNHVAAALPDGGYIFVWTGAQSSGVYAQRYDAAGNPVGGETFVNTEQGGRAYGDPAVTALADGGYIVAWTSNFPRTDLNSEIYAQRFNAAGEKLGGETRINTYTQNSQVDPNITALADGGFVVTWTSYGQDGSQSGIYAQRFNAAGGKLGVETRVNSPSTEYQNNVAVTALADSGYVVTWSSTSQDGSQAVIYVQRFNASGEKLGAETRVNSEIADRYNDASVTALDDGGYLVVWQYNGEILAQRFDAAGDKAGGEASITAPGTAYQPTVTGLANGGYVVTYMADNDVCAQRFDAAGNAVGAAARISLMTLDPHNQPTVTALDDGGYVIAWRSQLYDGFVPNDGFYYRRFDANGKAVQIAEANPGVLQGTQHADVMNGGLGDQIFEGRGGDDTLSGGAGNDRLFGNDGNDTLNGGSGDDKLYGGAGIDALNGGAGNDLLETDEEESEIGSDTLNGGSGDDTLISHGGADELIGGDGADSLTGENGNHVLYGGNGNDQLYADGGDQQLYGGAGDDTLYTYSGRIVANGGLGNDYCTGDLLNDVISGGGGNDSIRGREGDDILNGNEGNDLLNGDQNRDTLSGGAGNDLLDGGLDNDTLIGGTGADVFQFTSSLAGQNIDTIKDFSSTDGDKIQIESTLPAGALDPGHFVANADGVALDADDYIVYETDTGKLFYDADGTGAGAKIQFAVLLGAPSLTAADFMVI